MTVSTTKTKRERQADEAAAAWHRRAADAWLAELEAHNPPPERGRDELVSAGPPRVRRRPVDPGRDVSPWKAAA